MFVYVGGYTDPDRQGRGEGIYVFRMDRSSGTLTREGVVGGMPNPSFLALHPSRRFLYAVNGGDASGVSAFAIDPATGIPGLLNRQSAVTPNPAHVSVDPSGTCALIANYSGGTAAALPIEADGRLRPAASVVRHAGPTGPNKARQDMPHPHQIMPSPDGRFALVNDLGLDRTFVYRLDADAATLTPNDPPFAAAEPGAGPRHLAFHPNARHVYVINELDSTLAVYDYDPAHGTLTPLQRASTLPDGFDGENTTAQVVVHPSGRFVYGSNRGHDSIAIFAIDQRGRITPIGHEPTQGRTPRNFNLDPSGRFLYAANQDSGTLVTFRVDDDNGTLTPTGEVHDVGSPSCVIFRQA